MLDPFTGLGTTAVACARLGLDFVGVELDRGYLDVAVGRAEEALASLRAGFDNSEPRASRALEGPAGRQK